MPHTGSCLCGQTKVEISEESVKGQVICHCTDCRQVSGSAFSCNIVVPQKDVKVTGPLKEYTNFAESGNPVTRFFCSNCGSPITHKTPYFGDNQVVQTGLFLGLTNVPITAEVYVKDRWNGLAPIAGAAQVNAMPEKLRDVE